jgi:hypothetical protein
VHYAVTFDSSDLLGYEEEVQTYMGVCDPLKRSSSDRDSSLVWCLDYVMLYNK